MMKYSKYLIHYNHNHDRLGRFTTSSGRKLGEPTTLPKGYYLNTVQGVSPSKAKRIRKQKQLNKVAEQRRKESRPIYTYNPVDKWDSSVYKGLFTIYMGETGRKYIAEYQYKTLRDLKMPSREERVNEFKNLYKDKKYGPKMIKEMEPLRKNLIAYKIGNDKEQKEWGKIDFNNLKTEKDYEIAYKAFNHAMEQYYKGESTSEYMKRMSSKYDAMVDDNNKDVYNFVNDPIIIFKAKDVIETVGARPLPVKEMTEAENYVRAELKKKGVDAKI